MSPATTSITLELPAERVRLVEDYARRHGTSFAELVGKYLKMIEQMEDYQPSPRLREITGLIPSDADAARLFHDQLKEKYSR
jgi:hypothetical protein